VEIKLKEKMVGRIIGYSYPGSLLPWHGPAFGIKINNKQSADRFSNYFAIKIKNVLRQTSTEDNIYNGARKVMAENKFFMDQTSVRECIGSLKVKNTEGYDRIPKEFWLTVLTY
jgi:hypothetical protein